MQSTYAGKTRWTPSHATGMRAMAPVDVTRNVMRETGPSLASAEVAVAKYWAAEGGQRVVHAAAHLHGGVGVDRDYPLHRFFLLTRHIELTLGGANESLRRLGRILAAEPV